MQGRSEPRTVHEKPRKAVAEGGEHHDITRHSSGKNEALQVHMREEMAQAGGGLLLQLRRKAEPQSAGKEANRLSRRRSWHRPGQRVSA